jgi:hypothetical protein
MSLTDDELREMLPRDGQRPTRAVIGYATAVVAAMAIELLAARKALAERETTQAGRDVLAERERQKSVEGWTAEHDDGHVNGELARAAACYATPPEYRNVPFADGESVLDRLWPWAREWWKPTNNRRRMLVKAGALILAEIERLDRLPSPPVKETPDAE